MKRRICSSLTYRNPTSCAFFVFSSASFASSLSIFEASLFKLFGIPREVAEVARLKQHQKHQKSILSTLFLAPPQSRSLFYSIKRPLLKRRTNRMEFLVFAEGKCLLFSLHPSLLSSPLLLFDLDSKIRKSSLRQNHQHRNNEAIGDLGRTDRERIPKTQASSSSRRSRKALNISK